MNKFLLAFALLIYDSWLIAQTLTNKPFGVEINNNREGYGLIDTLLDGKKIVLLGELDHGDGSSFVVKTDLIKYLHEELGFNTLIFEASFINCGFLWGDIGDSSMFNRNIKHSIYNIWSEVEETKELFRYIEEQYAQGTPLKIAGIDPQFSGIENTQEFVSLLTNTLPTHITQSNSFSEFIYDLDILSTWMKYPKKQKCKLPEETFHSYCDTILEAVKKLDAPKMNLSLWKIYLENVKTVGKIKRKRDNHSFEIRDKQMFDNAAYLFKQNPDEKFIIWAANAHIIRKDNILRKKGKKFYLMGLKKLGDYLYENYAPSLYAVAVTSGKGVTLDFLNPTKKNILNTPESNSLEGLMQGEKTSFVDLGRFEKNFCLDQYKSQLFYTNIVCTAKWSQHIDGIIYIPEMSPSNPF